MPGSAFLTSYGGELTGTARPWRTGVNATRVGVGVGSRGNAEGPGEGVCREAPPYLGAEPKASRLPGLSDVPEGVVHLQEKLPRDVLQAQEVLFQQGGSVRHPSLSEAWSPVAVSLPAPESPVTRGPFLGHLPGSPGLPADHLPIPTAQLQGIKVTLQGKCLESMTRLRIVLISEANQPRDLKAGRPAGRGPIQGPRSEALPPPQGPAASGSRPCPGPAQGRVSLGGTPTPTRHRLCPGKNPRRAEDGPPGLPASGNWCGRLGCQGLPPQSRGSAVVCFSSSPRLRPSGQCGGGKSRTRLRPGAVRLRGPQGAHNRTQEGRRWAGARAGQEDPTPPGGSRTS